MPQVSAASVRVQFSRISTKSNLRRGALAALYNGYLPQPSGVVVCPAIKTAILLSYNPERETQNHRKRDWGPVKPILYTIIIKYIHKGDPIKLD